MFQCLLFLSLQWALPGVAVPVSGVVALRLRRQNDHWIQLNNFYNWLLIAPGPDHDLKNYSKIIVTNVFVDH